MDICRIATITFLASALCVVAQAQTQKKARTGADPTDFITRYEPSYEHKELDSGADLDLFVLRADIALRRDISFRIDLPAVHFNPDSRLEDAGFNSETGIGDIVNQILHKPFSNDKYAFIYGLRVDWDTASEDEIGQGGTTYAPMLVGAWFPNRKTIVAPVFQWSLGNNLDNDPLPGERDRNELSYRQIVIWQPMRKHVSWLMLDPELIIDFENDSDTALDVGLEYGKMLSKTTALFVKPTVGAFGERTDWAIKIGFRHMFPGKYLFK
jgi:hypothetical protein